MIETLAAATVFVIIAALAGVLVAMALDRRRERRLAAEQEREHAEEICTKIDIDLAKILRNTGMDDSHGTYFYRINDLPSDVLTRISGMVYDCELALRMKLSDVTSGTTDQKLQTAKSALEKIRQHSATVGYDSGDSGINKLATDALKAIEEGAEDEVRESSDRGVARK